VSAAAKPVAGGEAKTAPLSFGQRSLWFLDRLGLAGAAYNNVVSLRFAGRLEPAALTRALAALAERHEILRTRFPERDSEPVQLIEPAWPLDVAEVDLSACDTPSADREAERLRRAEAMQGFDLQARPPWRARLLRRAADDHELVLTLHHIISDGWSLRGVLVRELQALYAATGAQTEATLAPLAMQFGDYAAWEQTRLTDEVLQPHIDYWKRKLAGAPPELGLPFDRPRPPQESYRGAVVDFVIPAPVTSALKALGRAEGATLFMVLTAAFQTLLGRWSGQTDVVIGLPIATRARREAEALIGFFVNTLVLRSDLRGEPTFRRFLKSVKAGLLEAYAHQEAPFDRLVAALNPERDLSRQSLFQVMFEFRNFPRGEVELPQLKLTGFTTTVAASKFDLSLHLAELDGELRASFEYATDLFDAQTIERLAERLEGLLAAISADPDMPLPATPILTEPERTLLEEWTRTGVAFAADKTVHRLFAEQAARTPDAEAVMWAGGRLSYSQLDGLANRLAQRLRRLGTGPDAPVGLYLNRGPQMVVSVLAILKAGGAYLPLDLRHPPDRIAHILTESRAPLIIAEPELAPRLPASDAVVLFADAVEDGDCAVLAPEDLSGPQNLAYVLYTSGSTGKPKGVAMPHRPLVNLIGWVNATFERRPGRRIVQLAPISFDPSFQEIFSALLAGDTVCLLHDDLRFDPPGLRSLLKGARIDDLFVPQTTLDGLAEAHAAEGGPPPPLRHVLQGGEPLRLTPAVRRMFRDMPGARLHNVYGPTETHVVTWDSLPADPAEWPAASNIGRPIWNTRAYVLDAEMSPVPIGAAGELYIAGDCLARGYLNRPALTAERFTPSPFGVGERLYRTGDLVRWRADGKLDFIGRTDHQVKVRGLRIELGEIESVLLASPAVAQAVAVVREDTPGDKRLVAYVTGVDGAAPDAGELRARLVAALPDYMTPLVVALDAFTLTANGKIDRLALPAPDLDSTSRGDAAPRDGVEQLLAEIWCEVLRRPSVGVQSNFFELGGHSLSAARVAARMRDVFNLDIPVRALFEHQTIAALGVYLQRADPAERRPMTPRADRARAALSFSQERLLFVERLGGVGPAFNLPITLRLDGPLDRRALEQALAALVERHESLRTRFDTSGAEAVQVIDPLGGAALSFVDLTQVPADARMAACDHQVAEHVHGPFDLASGPLFRARLLRLAPADHVLSLVAHHIVLDGWSTGILMRELGSLYQAARQGRAAHLKPLPCQYGDFAEWQRRCVSGDRLERQLAYWREKLADAPPALELPIDRPRGRRQDYAGAGLEFRLPGEVTDGLLALARREGATLFMVLLAAWQALLARWSGQWDFVVGSPVAGRDAPEAEAIVGLCMNVAPLRAELGGEPTFREAIARTKEITLDAFANQDAPFEQLVQALRPPRDQARSPVFQVLFALQNTPPAEWDIEDLKARPHPTSLNASKYDLSLYVREHAGGLAAYLEYATALFDRVSIERLAARFERLLRAMVADPTLGVADWPWLDETERTQLAQLGVGERVVRDAETTVHGLIARQASGAPEAAAVICGARTVSFGALEARANRVAQELVRRGVRRGAVVGVCMERSPEQVAALLGVLKADAAYLPLDPSLPAERLRRMADGARAAMVIVGADVEDPLDGPRVWRLPSELPEAEASLAAPPGAATGADLAYVIYTSGSSGEPKGVMGVHAACVNRILSQAHITPAPDTGVYAQKGSPGFVDSLFEVLIPLAHGRPVVIVPASKARNPAKLLGALSDAGVSRLVSVPTLAGAVDIDKTPPAHRPRLQSWVLSGEALAAPLANGLSQAFPGCRVVNLYGSTEVTADATAYVVAGDEVGMAPIGRPIPNMQVYVLDEAFEPVPVGVEGELFVAGVGLTRGYVDQPALSAERYLPNPFGAPGARMFRTGDRARWRNDGQLEYLGRRDGQLKLRGLRIEPGEIEAALEAHPEVAAAAVVARDDAQGRHRLAAFIEARGAAPAVSELRSHLRRTLPDYMIPSVIVTLAALPRTSTGKLDRRALPTPAGAPQCVEDVPATPMEALVAGVWRGVLELAEVGVTDDFFEVGGHSLAVMRVIAQVFELTGLELPLQVAVETPTVRDMARWLDEAGPAAPPATAPPEPAAEPVGELAPSAAG
jgi:amino acid adenylation domain-containing protein